MAPGGGAARLELAANLSSNPSGGVGGSEGKRQTANRDHDRAPQRDENFLPPFLQEGTAEAEAPSQIPKTARESSFHGRGGSGRVMRPKRLGSLGHSTARAHTAYTSAGAPRFSGHSGPSPGASTSRYGELSDDVGSRANVERTHLWLGKTTRLVAAPPASAPDTIQNKGKMNKSRPSSRSVATSRLRVCVRVFMSVS